MKQLHKIITALMGYMFCTTLLRSRALGYGVIGFFAVVAGLSSLNAEEKSGWDDKVDRLIGSVHSLPVKGSQCMTAEEVSADKIRFIQTQMMVAALQCRRGHKGSMPKIYNDYVKINRTDLLASERRLSGYLKRQKQGTLSAYLTDLANRVSLESIGMPNFCRKMKVAGEMVLTMKKSEPIIPVLPVSYQQPQKSCLMETAAMSAE